MLVDWRGANAERYRLHLCVRARGTGGAAAAPSGAAASALREGCVSSECRPWVCGSARPGHYRRELRDCMGEALGGVGPTQPANVVEDRPVALGRLVARMWKAVCRLRVFLGGRVGDAVVLRCSGAAPPLLVGVGMRVTVSLEKNPASGGAAVLSAMCMRGTVARANGEATCALLRDDGEVELSVTPERIVALGRRRKLLYHARCWR
nr:unnamed protein product [Leishmania braziliensis]